MKFDRLQSDQAVMAELGRRIADVRLGRGLTQAELAEAAGVSKSTVERLEDGGSTQLGNLIRCLRALDRLEALERLFPETPPNPVDLIRRRGRSRRRARHREGGSPWTWGDER